MQPVLTFGNHCFWLTPLAHPVCFEIYGETEYLKPGAAGKFEMDMTILWVSPKVPPCRTPPSSLLGRLEGHLTWSLMSPDSQRANTFCSSGEAAVCGGN